MNSLQDTNIKVLLSASQQTAAVTGSVIDMAPTASVAKRGSKIVILASGVTGTTPVFTPAITECDTTNGTFTAVSSLTLSTITTNGTTEYHAPINQRYVKAAITTVSGTSATANLSVLVVNQLRQA